MSNFEHNWRRLFLITKESSHDIDTPVAYVSLNPKKLPTKIAKFCEQNWEQFEFDYDPFSMLLWPLRDDVSARQLADSLNSKYPGCANIVMASPSEAHGIIGDQEEDDSFSRFFGEND